MLTPKMPRRAAWAGVFGLVVASVTSAFVVTGASAAKDAADLPRAFVRQAQVLELERTGVPSPHGLTFSRDSGSFYVVDVPPGRGSPPAATDIVRLAPFELRSGSDQAGSAQIAAAVQDPINIAFDDRRSRLLLLIGNAGQLLDVRARPNGDLEPAALVRHDARRLGLEDPQGMTVDPASGDVFFLDASQPRIVRVEPDTHGGFAAAAVSDVDLRP